jgi:hypothetical protein
VSVDGTWNLTLNTPMGARTNTLSLQSSGSSLQGTMSGPNGSQAIEDGTVDGNAVSWSVNAPQLGMKITFAGTVDGDRLSGQATLGAFGAAPFEGSRA